MGKAEPDMQIFEQNVIANQTAGNVMLAVTALCNLAEGHLSHGRLDLAEQTYQRALNMALDAQGKPLPISSMALIGLGEIYRERNELDRALEALQIGIQRSERRGRVGMLDGYITLAHVHQANGDTQAANVAIQTAAEIAAEFDLTDMDDRIVQINRVHLRLAQGDLNFAQKWLENAVAVPSGEAGFFETHIRQHESMSKGRTLLALGRAGEAIPLLQPLTTILEQQGRNRRLAQVLMLLALAYHSDHQIQQAMQAIERALALAAEFGFVRILLDEGPEALALIAKAVQSGNAYARQLLAQVAEGESPGTEPSQPVKLAREEKSLAFAVFPEGLSERELEVLRFLKSRLTVPEIAMELCVAESTVRSHVKSIYGKLGVHRRVDAVQRARELELL
jgi:LuxR family maltose regulon positive regulatory protein